MKDNLCLKMGNGCKISFWKDPWIPELPGNRLLSTPPFEALDESVVAEFIINNQWDLSNVDYWLTGVEIEAIKIFPFHWDSKMIV